MISLSLWSLATLASGASVLGAEAVDASRARDGVDIFSRTCEAPVIVLAHVDKVGIRASLTVQETFRGRDLPGRLTLAFRAVNLGRESGAAALAIKDDDRAVFILTPALDSEGAPTKGNVYRPVGGALARIPLPAEGGEALLEALRQIVAYQDAGNLTTGAEDLNRWLTGVNPWLIDVALDQLARLGLADREMAPGLISRTNDANPERRIKAVGAIGTALSRGRFTDRRAQRDPTAGPDDLATSGFETIVRLARTDADARVRRAAVKELGRLRTERTAEILAAIERDDPAQDVRYEAAAALAGGPAR